MRYKVIGNSEFLIDLNGTVYDNTGTAVDAHNHSDVVTMEIFGKLINIGRLRLTWLSYYELDYPQWAKQIIEDVRFVPIKPNSETLLSYIPVFKYPIHVTPEHRLIGPWARYAINRDGSEILEISTTGTILKVTKITTNNGYRIKETYRTGFNHSVPVHRLVGYAWVKNNDYVLYPIINHMDGDIINNDCDNLEWCDYSSNVTHAFETGLRDDCFRCKVKDHETGEVTSYYSFSAFIREKNIYRVGVLKDVLARAKRGRFILSRYELKAEDDESPWVGDSIPAKTKSPYVITVKKGDEVLDVFTDSRHLKSKYKVWNVPNIDRMLERARLLHPDLTFEYIRTYAKNSIDAINIKTKQRFDSQQLRTIAKLTGQTSSKIKAKLRQPVLTTVNDWVFRYHTSKPWDLSNIENDDCCLIKLTNLKTKEVTTVTSIRNACRYTGICRAAIRKAMNSHPIKNWKFDYVANTE